MKCLSICFILFFSFTNLFSDTISPPSGDRFSLERKLEWRKRRLDSTLKSTDAYMDSITGKKKEEIDTLLLLYNYRMLKKREAEARDYFWIKVGTMLLLMILAVGFWFWKYKNKSRKPDVDNPDSPWK